MAKGPTGDDDGEKLVLPIPPQLAFLRGPLEAMFKELETRERQKEMGLPVSDALDDRLQDIRDTLLSEFRKLQARQP